MRIYTFAPATGHNITDYGSQGVILAPILRAITLDYLACFYLEPHGVISGHKAAKSQLLLIVSGDAIVTGGDSAAIARDAVQTVTVGDAVLWHRGEWHETEAGAGGLTAVVMESDMLDHEAILRLQIR